MSEIEIITNRSGLSGLMGLIISVLTAMIGYTIHHSGFWSIMDFFFWPFAWIKWLVLQQVNLDIIKHTFSRFFN